MCCAVQVPMSAEAYQAAKWEREIEERNRPLSDEELDAILPPEGFKVLEPPGNYQPIRTPARKAMSTPTPIGGTPMYSLPTEDRGQAFDVPAQLEGLPDMKPEDQQYFGALLKVRCVAMAPAALTVRACSVRMCSNVLQSVSFHVIKETRPALQHKPEHELHADLRFERQVTFVQRTLLMRYPV